MTAQPPSLSISLIPDWAYESAITLARVIPRPAWTQEGIVAAMHTWTNAHGRPPRSYEWAPATGRAAGLLPWSPAQWELEYPRWPSTGTVADRFGSWCNGLRAAGLPARNPDHDVPRADRIDAARRLAANGMSLSSIADTVGIGKSTVWGYLHAGDCPECGGPLISGEVCVACAPRRKPMASPQDALQALVAWQAEHRRAPHEHEWGWSAGPDSPWVREFPRWPSASSVCTHFGSWNAGLLAAGLPVQSRAWSDEAIVDALVNWATARGRPPRYADFRTANDRNLWPDPKTVSTRFGGWRAALAKARLA